MVIGIVFALVSALTIAISSVLLKKAIKNFSSYSEFFVFSLISLIIWPLALYFIPFNSGRFIEGLVYGTLSGIMAQGYYIYVISKGDLSVTSTLISTYPIFTIIFAMLISKESLTVIGMLAVALIIIGTLIVAFSHENGKRKLKLILILLPLSVALGVGFSDALSNRFIDSAGASTFLLATAIVQIPISLILMALNKEKLSDLKKVTSSISEYKNALFGALFLSVGTLCIFLAFAFVPASIASPISGTAPAFTVILAYIVLKERISRKNLVGIVLILAGILMISF